MTTSSGVYQYMLSFANRLCTYIRAVFEKLLLVFSTKSQSDHNHAHDLFGPVLD